VRVLTLSTSVHQLSTSSEGCEGNLEISGMRRSTEAAWKRDSSWLDESSMAWRSAQREHSRMTGERAFRRSDTKSTYGA